MAAPPKLPAAYTSVLDAAPPPPGKNSSRRASSHGAQLPWTDDEQLEAADRQAIRRAEAARLNRLAQAQASLPPPPTVVTRLPAHLDEEVLANALMLLDKPLGWEADEVARCVAPGTLALLAAAATPSQMVSQSLLCAW